LGAHVAAEFATAGLLIAAGFGLLGRKAWGGRVFLLALGMLLYTLIASPGYYLELGVLGFVLMFAALLALALVFAVAAVKRKGGFE
jgi:peptidoglycan/LPS O-acetylase OafA/YrhL